MSFIQEETKEKSSFWDYFLLFSIIFVVVGFLGYYHLTKKSTLEGFEKANLFFIERKYEKSLELYEELKGADYLEPSHDSILSQRLDTLYTLLDK